MSSNNDKNEFDRKLRAVKVYLDRGGSLRRVAKEFSIPHTTLWEWVKLYRTEGGNSLKKERTSKRRISKEIEKKVMFLKEQRPSLSVHEARQMLKRQGITISNNGVWQIWKRYGLAKRSIYNPLSPFGITTIESSIGIAEAKALINDSNYKAAAKVLNDLPSMPETQILKEIPEKLLSPHKRLNRLYLQFGEIPFSDFRKKARRIGQMLERRGYNLSSILANFLEVYALGWIGKPDEAMAVLDILAKKMRNIKNSSLWFLFYCQRAMGYCRLLKMSKALSAVRKCRSLVHVLPAHAYHEQFGNILTFLGKFREATQYYTMVIEHEKEPKIVGRILLKAAYLRGIAGEYEKCRRLFTKARVAKDTEFFGSTMYRSTQACICFGRGDLTQASTYFQESLKKASKGEVYNQFYSTSTGLAAVAMALNKKAEAKMHLKKCLSVMKKCGLTRETLILRQLLGSTERISDELLHMPTLHLINLLVKSNRTVKIGDYRKAFHFAQSQKLLGLFQRWIVFFPATVLSLLEKGKQTGLPKTLLNFPLFNQNVPVYHIKFLGDLSITKDQRYLRIKPSPQEKAFLIHLALRAGAPGRFILLNDLYQNFWKQSSRPLNLLLHLLARLKKQLKIPGHFLGISSAVGKPRLINRGVYITTDYNTFETLLTQVKSFERAGDWQFAKRDYLRMFKLIRGELFEKMYDPWSENFRAMAKNKFEHELIHFIKECKARNDYKTVDYTLGRAEKILKHDEALSTLRAEVR